MNASAEKPQSRILKLFLSARFARFLASGAVNTALSYLLYLALLPFLTYAVSYTVAYVAGIVISYLLNRFFVFREGRGLASAAVFPLVYLVQFLLAQAILWLWVDLAGWDARLAPLAAICLTIPVTFVLSRWVFVRDDKG